MCCCVRGYGRRRARLNVRAPTCWPPFPYGLLHVWLVRCWLACVWSVYGRVVVAAAVWLGPWVCQPPYGQLILRWFFLLLPALLRPRLSCRRCVRSGLIRAKVRVCATRYGESLWPWGRRLEVIRCGWFAGCRTVESRRCGALLGMVAAGSAELFLRSRRVRPQLSAIKSLTTRWSRSLTGTGFTEPSSMATGLPHSSGGMVP